MKTIFGPAGIPINQSDNISGIKYSSSKGLLAYELEFVRGVKMSEQLMKEVKKTAEECKVTLSCHAPYWINCCNEEKFDTNKRNLIQSINASVIMGLKTIVFRIKYIANVFLFFYKARILQV